MLELAPQYRPSEFDPLNPSDLLRDEIQQRRETGYDVDDVIERANGIDAGNRLAVLALVDELAETERTGHWGYGEPDGLDDVQASLLILRPSSRRIRRR